MGVKTHAVLIDDLDGAAPAAETVRFGLDDINYSIDLTAENAAKLRADMANWIAAARRETPGNGPAAVTVDETRELPARVRAWARKRNIAVGNRGRLPAELIERYLQANATSNNGKEPGGADV